ncbi:MAG TPA: fluoride efflux transporter CrcB [Kiritimatiellia bacterium]|nr:fluoride efflux transporter CrcB [Kiritimatiellia bacterium]
MKMLVNSLMVGAGGFVGSVARYLLSVALQSYSFVFPAGTLLANVAGCFLIGVLSQITLSGSLSPGTRLALGVGFCGGFTTASSFVYETAQFLREGEYFHGGSYVVGTLAASFISFYAGVLLVKVVTKSAGDLWN